jgi:hypothetical protein
VPFGPSTTAPFKIGGEPSSDPTRFATWWWMQCGKVVPSPTMNEEPQAFAPRTLASQRPLQAAWALEPVSSAYSLAITDSPVPCVAVSHVAHGKPNWNGSDDACAIALSRAFSRSASSSVCVTSRPAGLPAPPIALCSS